MSACDKQLNTQPYKEGYLQYMYHLCDRKGFDETFFKPRIPSLHTVFGLAEDAMMLA